MSEATRNPTGMGENAGVLALAGYIGVYLAGLVDDPALSNVIIVGVTILGKTLLTLLNNAMGGTLVGLMNIGPMKGSVLKVFAAGALVLGLLSFAPAAHADSHDDDHVLNFYTAAIGWPPQLSLGHPQFVRVGIRVVLSNIHLDGDVNPMVGLCLWDDFAQKFPLCPRLPE